MKTKKIFIIAGEKSGDLLGEKIIKSLKKKAGNNKIEFVGVGGELMQAEGLKSIFPMEDLSIMGVMEILPRLFKIIGRINQTVKAIIKSKPDLVLTIDSPDFSFRVIKKVKKLDKNNEIKKAHLIAPSVWAYRKGRAKKIAKIYDLLLCILPFEPPYFEKYGLKTVFIGHPIFDKGFADYSFDKKKFLKEFDMNEKDTIISVTSGSRLGEVEKLLPIAIESINFLKKRYKDISVFVLATKKTLNLVGEILKKYKFKASILLDEDHKYKAMKSSKVALAKSGTNTFEFNIYKLPMVVYYKFNWLTTKIGRMISNIQFANLVNIIENREVITECVLEKCKPNLIAEKLEELLNDDSARNKQVKESQKVIKKLGFGSGKSSADKGADEILEIIG